MHCIYAHWRSMSAIADFVSRRSLTARGHGWTPTTAYIGRLLMTLIGPKINEKYVGIFG